MHIERLGRHHDLAGFDSGTKELDDWLRDHALGNQERDLSRVFVLVDDDDLVIGFYSLTMGGVTRSDLPKTYGRGLPNVSIGMALLGRLAVLSTRQGEGLGRDLLVDAIGQCAMASSHVAGKFIAVDPSNEAARDFYRHFGFREVPDDEGGRMYLRVDHAMAALTPEG